MVETKQKTAGMVDNCSSCGSDSVIRDYKLGRTVCRECGKVAKQNIKDRGPEWREYSQEEKEDRNRRGAPTTLTIHDKGLSTLIDTKNRDAKGKSLPPNKRSLMYRLRKWQKRSKVSDQKDRNLIIALSELNRMSSQLGLPKKVEESASKIYREAVEKDLIQGHSIEGVVASALYVACRENEIPRTLDEIASVNSREKREISRNYRTLSRELDIHLSPINPGRFVSRLGSDLDISGKARTKALALIRKAEERNLTVGKNPVSIAAATIYMASHLEGEKKSQREVAEESGVTQVTIRSRYREIAEELEIELDS